MNLELLKYKTALQNKVFIFKVGSYNNVGGAETKAITLAEILKNEIGAKVYFLANGGDGDLKSRLLDGGFECLVFPFQVHKQPHKKALIHLRQIMFLRKYKPDYILPWSSDNNKAILPFWRWTGAKYAWWNMQDEGRGLYKNKNEEKLMKEASNIISNSIAGLEFITNNYNIRKEDIVLYNNPTEPTNINELKPIWRKKLSIDNETLVVSMFANLIPFKDHLTLVKSWKKVVNHFSLQNTKIQLLLAGRGRQPTTNQIKILAFDLGIADSITLLGSISEVKELMLESDLVVHSSNTEGCPNAVCEAMSVGKAVVATDIPGDREALSEKFEQYTLSIPNNPDDLAKKMIKVLEDKQLANDIGAFNKQRIETEYTLEGMVNTLFPLFLNK